MWVSKQDMYLCVCVCVFRLVFIAMQKGDLWACETPQERLSMKNPVNDA